MKRFYGLCLFGLFIWLFSSCELENDNIYDNPNFNEVQVNVEESEAPSTILQFETLEITPSISQSQQSGESNLSYEWTLRTDEQYLNAPIDSVVATISRERDLQYEVNLTTGDWKIVLRVTDDNTGVTATGQFFITVQNQFSEGWLLLEEKNEMGDLSIILPDGNIFRNIYSSINPDAPLETPLRQLVVTNFSYGVDEIVILSESSGVRLDYNELLKVFDLQDLFWEIPVPFRPEYHAWHDAINGWVINNGKVHIQVRGGFPGETKYGTAMAFPVVGDDYHAAPFVAQGSHPYDGPYPAVIYDEQGQYFVYLSIALSPTLKNFPPAPADAPFDMNNVGLDMVYMETGNTENLINAIMKDDSDEYFMLQIQGDQAEPARSYRVMNEAPEIADHTAFETSKTLDRVYYSAGNTIYLYDIPSGLIIGSPFSLPGGESVTAMEISSLDPTVMLVTTWDNSEGRVYKLALSGTGEMSISNEYEGFGKIIDLAYKN
ncbi:MULTISPECIES: PKD-like family lipoprotein [unclassified Leeuwenhoekiella]|uniref:PKD-like family lipoprotein n=1 Tax=unclassified Leeuwenhoekiella TaxID=2615029 RepID=UPI000C5800D5|nr:MULTISPECIES: PKD-like family lipoprotein [unclassified Leeuwenhoekiella]MAW95389.1 hypothetical protein [Leeuwenhoekiella sp.]MBA80776.1 hypothetical protein [Leeuwenhoekiella sp.]|tara:strand:- start:2309 stop:3778 length:1470 start_codon:yes stop_codon:yes gene_type:complete